MPRRYTVLGLFVLCLSVVLWMVGFFGTPPLSPQGADPSFLTIQTGVTGIRGRLAFQIVEVKPGSPAERAGLKPDDFVLAVNGQEIRDIEEVHRTIQDPFGRPGQDFTIRFCRLNPSTRKFEESTAKLRSE